MGAKRIGLIGVDFTDHHFFAKTGKHPLAPQFDSINEQYCRLAESAKSLGIKIFNLSKISRLTAFPKISVDEFENFQQPDFKTTEKAGALKIVSYATTPVAGVPAILARCINTQTEHSARCVWATNSYGNGVEFAGDVEWQNQPQYAEHLLSEADLIIVHNGKIAPEHENLLSDQALLTMAHNYLWNVDERFVKQGFAGVVVGQYQAALDEFENWSVVPNPIPFWEREYRPENKAEKITICYTPSGKHEKYPLEHRLYWHSKGYQTTVRILEKLAKQFPIKLEVIRDRQISHSESLAMKGRSHIVIDECVTGSYHRNSLEGLACGAVVINGLGILPKVVDVLRFCAGAGTEIPFISATLENLEEVLTKLIRSGHENLIRNGANNRAWLENYWNFSRQWQKFWIPATEKSFKKINRYFCPASTESKKSNDILSKEVVVNHQMKVLKDGVSVVIPHGGKYRLPHLRACLANLRQCRQVGEIIVVEMDESPLAVELARRWADKYVFIRRTDLFERARTLNIGSAFAECEFVLWLDNDLLIPNDFISRAVIELCQRNLDFLKPYTEVKYLSLADSENVMQGILNPDQCRPANIYSSTTTDGGAGLIRREFLQSYGGIPAGFHGWGGEDNGWVHKVSLLGKGGRTESGDQKIFHLYHALSGGNGGNAHLNANPHYQTNLSLLGKIKATGNPRRFLEDFPPTAKNLWEDSRPIYFIGDENLSIGTARELFDLFGAQVELISPENLNNCKNPSSNAIVFFDCQAAFDFLSDESFALFGDKTLIVANKNCAFTAVEEAKLRNCFGVLAIDETIAGKLRHRNINHWLWNSENHEELDFRSLALALAQPLSILLNNQTDSVTLKKTVNARQSDVSDLPVWFYWEGARPEWIEACHRTIVAKARNVRFLTPKTFSELWTED
ncbi:MAG: glycosyltransferase, partial [Actinomycetota bacterium]